MVTPERVFNIDRALIDENSPIRGLTAEEYETLKSSTRVYDNGKLVAIELTKILNKIDCIFSQAILGYILMTKSTGVVLYFEGGEYHVVHLTSPFKWNTPITFTSSKVNDSWRKWNHRLPTATHSNLDKTLTKGQRGAYESFGIMQAAPLFVTSPGHQITLGETSAVTRDPTEVITATYNADQPIKAGLDPKSAIFRDIVAGQKMIKPPPFNFGTQKIFLIDSSLYFGINTDKQNMTDPIQYHATVLYSQPSVIFIDEEGVQSIRSEEDATGEIIFLNSQNPRGYERISLEEGVVRTKEGVATPIMELTEAPFYPNPLLNQHLNGIVNSVIIVNENDNAVLDIFRINALKKLIFEYAIDSEFLHQAFTPLVNIDIPCQMRGEGILKTWRTNPVWPPQKFTALAAKARRQAAEVHPAASIASASEKVNASVSYSLFNFLKQIPELLGCKKITQ